MSLTSLSDTNITQTSPLPSTFPSNTSSQTTISPAVIPIILSVIVLALAVSKWCILRQTRSISRPGMLGVGFLVSDYRLPLADHECFMIDTPILPLSSTITSPIALDNIRIEPVISRRHTLTAFDSVPLRCQTIAIPLSAYHHPSSLGSRASYTYPQLLTSVSHAPSNFPSSTAAPQAPQKSRERSPPPPRPSIKNLSAIAISKVQSAFDIVHNVSSDVNDVLGGL